MSAVNESLLQLHHALYGRQLPFLKPDYYARSHGLFVSCSNQRFMIIDWLCQRVSAGNSNSSSPPRAILSIGCGDGLVDIALAKYLLSKMHFQSPLVYVGVEPHIQSAQKFRRQFASVDGLEARVISNKWPECASELDGQQFDIILFVHSLYHVVDVDQALEEALRLLHPQGQLILFMVNSLFILKENLL
jgi:SAM-dependent methyltransferase